MPLAPGQRMGRYEIVEPLGAGGMGAVYRARDPLLGRAVALKVIAGHGADAEAFGRFEQEARAAAALSHPNIVTVFDVGRHEGDPYLVCELLEGRTLRRRLADGAMPAAEAIGAALQVCRGMAAAHAAGVVHRDLKPENLFLTGDGRLRILDFGLAKLRGDDLAGGEQDVTLALTRPGLVVGTVDYMAPEQARGEEADARTDVFALGVVLHEMLSGRAPFRRGNPAETMAAILREDPPPLPDDGGTTSSSGLAAIVQRCLAKEPRARFQSMTELQLALETAAAGTAPRDAADRAPSSIAVLPFADMSPARDQAYFCEGVAEELLNALGRVGGLRIAARSAAFRFQGPGIDLRAAGVALGVGSILEGSVRKAGDRLRVTVQLVDVATGYQLWSQRFDGRTEDVFEIQDSIAEGVVAALRGAPSAEERSALRQRPSTEVATYDLFLRARQQVNRFRGDAVREAITLYRQALELDPRYAPAWAGLADAHNWLYQWWGGGRSDLVAADEASRRALELAPHLAEAHASRGFALGLLHRYEEAWPAFEEALRLDPNLFDASYYYARTCFSAGRIERSAELFARAAETRREDFQAPALLAQALEKLGREAEAQLAHHEAIARARRVLALSPNDARALSLTAGNLWSVGESEEAFDWAERAIRLYPHDQGVHINGLCLMAKAGRRERAFELLEIVGTQGWGKKDWILHDPDYDALRDDPRFQAFLDRLS